MNLTEMKCVPCRGGVPPLTDEEIQSHMPQVPEWNVLEVNGIPRLQRQYKFKNFAQALAFTNAIGALAEEQDHHPAILTEWGKVTVSWWTHKIKGLHLNDFIMAARSDEAYTP
jgi:4a-hydroxytetrahydrobiopterin dehydratase